MALYAVDYDLRKPGRKYDSLYEAIKSYPDWAHVLQSSWVIETPATAQQVRDNLLRHIDANDAIVVKKLTGDAAWAGLSDEISKWLQRVRV